MYIGLASSVGDTPKRQFSRVLKKWVRPLCSHFSKFGVRPKGLIQQGSDPTEKSLQRGLTQNYLLFQHPAKAFILALTSLR